MKCIFTCVFSQESYVQLCFLWLESIYIYGNIGDADILIYTTTPFMKMIKRSNLWSPAIKFEINDTYTTLDSACKARLDLFKFSCSAQYEQFLYLDTDILITADLNPVFDVVQKDVLYAMQEGTLDGPWWGKELFGDEIHLYEDQNAFTCAILLFNNCEAVRELFRVINVDMTVRTSAMHDQSYIVYNAFKHQLFDNKALNALAENVYHCDLDYAKTIHHYPYGPGQVGDKSAVMIRNLNSMKDRTIDGHIQTAKAYINEHLMPIVTGCGVLLEGSIFMLHHTGVYTDVFLNKCKNISVAVLNRKVKTAMEIGFNAGFSALLLLLCNPELKIDCFDLGEHAYVKPCFQKLKETFGDRISLVLGDSRQTLRQVDVVYDVIHIDGGHSTDVAESDIVQSYRLAARLRSFPHFAFLRTRTFRCLDTGRFGSASWL